MWPSLLMRHGPLPALLAVADGHLSRRMAHMMDATNSVDELVMVGASSIEAGCQFTIRTKIDNFLTHPGLEPGPRRRLRHSVHTVSVARLVSTAELHLTLMYMLCVMYAPAIHFYTFDPSSALDVTDAGVPCVAWTLGAGVHWELTRLVM